MQMFYIHIFQTFVYEDVHDNIHDLVNEFPLMFSLMFSLDFFIGLSHWTFSLDFFIGLFHWTFSILLCDIQSCPNARDATASKNGAIEYAITQVEKPSVF